MASAAALSSPVTPDFLRASLDKGGKSRFNQVQLVDTAEGEISWRAFAFLVRYRANGFMVVLPAVQEVHAVLGGCIPEGEEACASTEVEMAMETSRGRALGNLNVVMADLLWSYLSLFRRTPPKSTAGRVIMFKVGSTACKPVEQSALDVGHQWIGDCLDPATGQEYTDAMEDLEGDEFLSDGQLGQQDEEPTPSIAAAEQSQRLLYMQMQQTNSIVQSLLMQKQPSSDPLSAVLNVSDSASGNSSGSSVNVKGYVARDAFLKHLEDDARVVQVIRQNARTELGVTEAKEEPSLLRTYLESRVPIGDHRLLGHMGYMMAWGWEQAATTGNTQMLAFCGKMMSYVEQAALDGSRSSLAWLLTGLPEVNHQLLAVNKKRQSLTPFAKLPAPAWVAANVSFLKDVDAFETRLRQLGTQKPQPTAPGADPDDPSAKSKAKPKKPKGGSKGANQSTDPAAANP
eukprot:Skav232850  [mRNA]  locus=scaffold1834:908626:909999:- [translate_table: standard]